MGADYLAVSASRHAENIEIKVSFNNSDELNKWAKALADEIQDEPVQKLANDGKRVTLGSADPANSSTTMIKRNKTDLIEISKGDDPIDAVSPELASRKKQPNIPGYVSKFTQFLNNDDKELLSMTEDLYKNRTDWNLDRASQAALCYTSKTVNRIKEEFAQKHGSNNVAKQDENEQNLIDRIDISAILALLAVAYLCSFILPNFMNLILALAICGLAVFYKIKETEKNAELEEENKPKPFRSYKVKIITNCIGLPDDIAKALFVNEKRKQWDLYGSLLNESSSKLVLHKRTKDWFQIFEKRTSAKNTNREILIELTKIKGKPYFLKMTAFTTVNNEMQEKMGEEGIMNNFNSLRNFVLTEDSVSELNVSLSNVTGEMSGIHGNPMLTITDMIREIEEVDMAEDGMTEIGEEDKDENFQDIEEIKYGIEEEVKVEKEKVSVKELSFEEKFEQDVQK
jgi:hypothetical protein